MVYSLSSTSRARPVSAGSRGQAAVPETTLAAARQFKVLQSRAAPAQLELPLGGVTITPLSRASAAGKSFRTE
jgi:hypothetical protein